MEELFVAACRLKLRFETERGVLSSEDLWDLPLKTENGCSLNRIAQQLNRQIKDDFEDDFVGDTDSPVDNKISLRFEIVKRIIEVKKAEAVASKSAAEARATKQKILAILAEKENDALKDKSIEDLKALLGDL